MFGCARNLISAFNFPAPRSVSFACLAHPFEIPLDKLICLFAFPLGIESIWIRFFDTDHAHVQASDILYLSTWRFWLVNHLFFCSRGKLFLAPRNFPPSQSRREMIAESLESGSSSAMMMMTTCAFSDVFFGNPRACCVVQAPQSVSNRTAMCMRWRKLRSQGM